MTRRRRGGVKRGETDLASNQFPKCSPQLRTPRDSQSEVEKRRGREDSCYLLQVIIFTQAIIIITNNKFSVWLEERF